MRSQAALERSAVADLSTDLDDLVGEAHAFAAASRADATLRAYRGDWADFTDFCDRHALTPFPADPAAVALYVTDLARRLRPSTINRRVAAISIYHQREGVDSPTRDPRVREIMKGIRRRLTAATHEAGTSEDRGGSSDDRPPPELPGRTTRSSGTACRLRQCLARLGACRPQRRGH